MSLQGAINLSTRSLPCIPSGLFEIHLGITTDRLKSVPDEPPLPPADTQAVLRRGAKRDTPTWFEAQDLQVLKAWNNDIVEIQHEISLFGSLKTIDVRSLFTIPPFSLSLIFDFSFTKTSSHPSPTALVT